MSVFCATDAGNARETVQELIKYMGFVPVNAGSLQNARYLEPLAGLNIYLGYGYGYGYGYGAGFGATVAPSWIGIE